MSRPSISIVLTVALALTLLTLVNLQGQNNTRARPSAVAVLSLQDVFKSLDEKSSIDADLTRRSEQMQKAVQERRQELKGLESDLDVYAPGTDAFKQTQTKYRQKGIELEVFTKMEAAELERESAIQIEGLYLKVIDAARKKAERDGIDVVLYKDPTDSARGRTQREVVEAIQSRKVLYSAPELDITADVTQMLNNEFNNRPKAGK